MSATLQRAVIINDRSAMVGGASNLAILSARFLASHGVDVVFFAGDEITAPAPVARTINLGCPPLTLQGKAAAFVGGLYNAKAYSALKTLIAEDTPSTIYHVHGWSKILSPSIFRALAPVRSRVILHAHDYFLACPNGGFANFRTNSICTLTPMSARCLGTQCDKRGYHEKLWRSLRHVIRQQLFPTGAEAPNIVVVHERMKDYLVKSGINVGRTHTIRNPVDAFSSSGTAPWLKKSFFFIGRLEPEKGFADAASAARAAGAPLQIIGDGAGRALLERDFPDVIIHGWQNRDGVARLIQDARAVIVSSRVPEPFSLAAVEAVASGIPVIMPSEALIGQEIFERNCGLTFKSGDILSLSEAIRTLHADDTLVRQMAMNCLREGPSLTHTTATWNQALLDLYQSVLASADLQKTG
ncbi:glycosyltransferase family 4 protein [Rhizobium sp. TH2]|uniref:glycosyltransferase family 4 protein n=1 Tax=Rhizobium sp. TH2 TaxID=2775403 RepID=UPI0021586398|nr:glycosyltransferase family 4 protein [Rhizobium sp. TH2]UVC07726.1 glycosyltransferase family 4 protein [Rhizobium sp. TH2]